MVKKNWWNSRLRVFTRINVFLLLQKNLTIKRKLSCSNTMSRTTPRWCGKLGETSWLFSCIIYLGFYSVSHCFFFLHEVHRFFKCLTFIFKCHFYFYFYFWLSHCSSLVRCIFRILHIRSLHGRMGCGRMFLFCHHHIVHCWLWWLCTYFGRFQIIHYFLHLVWVGLCFFHLGQFLFLWVQRKGMLFINRVLFE